MKTVVTGGAGFIGRNLLNVLQASDEEVLIVDNFSSSKESDLQETTNVKVINMDLTNPAVSTNEVFRGFDRIIHLAANVDNRFSWENPHLSVKSNVDATLNVGLVARNFDIPKIIYASTGTIYGDNSSPPFEERFESSEQTTLYGATKYAAEGILSVFATHYGIKVTAFRFVGVLGPYSTHGHLHDFVKKLKLDPNKLEVLGNGYQKKAYIHVEDLIKGILTIDSPEIFDVFNLGRPDYSTVRDSIRWLLEVWGISPEVSYQTTDRGWIGDNPFLQLDVKKAFSSGWVPTYTIEEAVKATVMWLLDGE
jgi:UDP-glucose 4-epimerase